MRALDFPCRNRVSTLSCLPVSAWRVGGHWTLTLAWALGLHGFLPFFSDLSLLYLLKRIVCASPLALPYCDHHRQKFTTGSYEFAVGQTKLIGQTPAS